MNIFLDVDQESMRDCRPDDTRCRERLEKCLDNFVVNDLILHHSDYVGKDSQRSYTYFVFNTCGLPEIVCSKRLTQLLGSGGSGQADVFL
jgi:hypothetical protein